MSNKNQKKPKKEVKISQNVTLSAEANDFVEETRKPENENRTFSNMVDTLILEAKAARLAQK